MDKKPDLYSEHTESEEQLRQVLLGTRTVLWRVDTRSKKLSVSANARGIYGLLEGSELDCLDRGLELLHPADADGYTTILTGIMEAGGSYELEYRIIRPDNQEVVWLEERGTAFCDESAEVVSIVGIANDITSRRRAEESLRFQFDLTKNITDNATTAIFMMDAESRCTFMNPAAEKMFGYSFSEVENQILHNFIHHHHPDGRAYPVSECPIDRALPEENQVHDYEDVFIRKNGEFFPVICNAIVIHKEGRAIGTVIEVRDVSEDKASAIQLKRLLDSLEAADTRKNHFLASLSHELRNPLAPIRTGLEIMRTIEVQPEIEELRAMMERQTQQLIRLIDDLLDVTRITQGKLELSVGVVNLEEVIRSATEASAPVISENEQDLIVSLPDQGVQMTADAHRLAQVITNLLHNASKYTPPGGRIWLTVERRSQKIAITVADTGIGIPQEKHEEIFEMFSQIDSSMEARYRGLGIGLSIAKRLVELHGGSIEVFSAGKNLGAEFRIRLPLEPCAPVPQKEAVSQIEIPGHLKVLIVDDNEEAADSLGMLLNLTGNDVAVAYSGAQALQIAAEFQPDAVLMDLGMPEMDGCEAARRMREQDWGNHILLIALTGWGQQEDRTRTAEAGFDHHLVKPANPAEIHQILLSRTSRSLGYMS